MLRRRFPARTQLSKLCSDGSGVARRKRSNFDKSETIDTAEIPLPFMKALKQIFLAALTVIPLLAPSTASCFYNSTAGRWLNRDPIEEEGGKNLCGAFRNDSVSRYDKHGKNPLSPEDPPPGNLDSLPAGPFSKCRIALRCTMAHAPGGIPVGILHCGLIIDTGDGVYYYNGSGGSINTRWVTPATTSDATGPWKDFGSSVCECLFANVKPWNDRQVPRVNSCENSNWNLKCAVKKCSVALDWGTQDKPLGYNCQRCLEYSKFVFPSGPTAPVKPCCLKWGEAPCPDE